MHDELCILHCTISSDGMLGGKDIIHTTDGRVMRS